MAGCGDVLSLEDLQTAKKHQIFEAEVITGKQGGVAGGASIDYATNQVTGQVQKTLPAILRDTGFRPAPFTFVTGGNLAVGDSDVAVLWPISGGGDGQYYLWKGPYPKTVPAASSPASTGGVSASGWLPLGDVTLRGDLASAGGVNLVNGAINSANPVGDGYKSTDHYGGVIIGDNPLGSPGDDFPLADSLRDAVNVSRKINAEPTNCHAFADKTVIDSPSDYGGYGAFDATTIVRGSHSQDHVAAFQARIRYSGTGSIDTLWGVLVTPVADSTGLVKRSVGVDISGVTTSTATVERSIAVNITQTATTIENVGVKVSDAPVSTASMAPSISFLSSQGASGYSFAGSSGGHLYNSGGAGFGVDPKLSPSYKLMVSEDGGTTICGLGASAFTGAYMATPTDTKISFYSGGANRLSILSSGNSSALTPGADNTQPNGLPFLRWSVFHAGTGTINTSDARDKTEPLEISDVLLDVADCISIGAWKWLDAVAKKGEDSARWHFGPIAQQIRDAFAKYGLDGCDYGLLCYDKWGDQFENEFAEDGKTVIGQKLVVAAGERWGIRPDQCLWLKMAAVERRCAKIEERLSKAGL